MVNRKPNISNGSKPKPTNTSTPSNISMHNEDNDSDQEQQQQQPTHNTHKKRKKNNGDSTPSTTNSSPHIPNLSHTLKPISVLDPNASKRSVHFSEETQFESQSSIHSMMMHTAKEDELRAMNHSTANMLSTASHLGKTPTKLPMAMLYSCGRCAQQNYFKKTDSLACPNCKYKIMWKTSHSNTYHFLTSD